MIKHSIEYWKFGDQRASIFWKYTPFVIYLGDHLIH